MAGQTFTQKIRIHLDGANKASKGANKVSSSMGRLAKSAAGAAAAFFGARMIIDGLKQSIELSAKAENLSIPFENLNKAMGGTSGALSKYRKALDGTVNDVEIMRMANQAMTLGVANSEEEMGMLFDTAQRLGKSLGVDTRQAVDSLVTGMGRQSIMMLDNLGIIVDTEGAYQTYATTLGVTTSKLTDQQKKIAFNNAALDSAKEKVAALGDENLTTSDAISQMNVAVDNALIAIGESLAPVIVNMAEFFGNAATAVSNFFSSFTESDVERTIRELKELGSETLRYEIILKKQKIQEIKDKDLGHGRDKRLLKEIEKARKAQSDYIMIIQDRKEIEKARAEEAKKNAGKEEEIIISQTEGMKEQEKADEAMLERMRQAAEGADDRVKNLKNMLQLRKDLKKEEEELKLLEEERLQRELKLTGMIDLQTNSFRNFGLALDDIGEKYGDFRTDIQEANPFLNRMSQAFNDIIVVSQKSSKEVVKAGMAIGASAEDTSQAVTNASIAFITAYIQQAIAIMIQKAFGEVGFFGGLAVAAGSSVVGRGIARNIQSITAAEGFDGIVNEPTLILAGEAGAEYVDIEPTNNEGAGRGGGTVIFQGNIMSDDFIVEEAIPKIRKALQRGESLGIS